VPDWSAALFLKLTGALVGSAIAAWLRNSVRWAFQIFTGAWFGVWSGQWLMDYMAWPPTVDYILLSGSIMGAASCSILEGIFHLWPDIRAAARGWLVSKAGKAEQE